MDDFASDASVCLFDLRPSELLPVLQYGTDLRELGPSCQMRSGRGEDVAAVKCATHRMLEEGFVGDGADTSDLQLAQCPDEHAIVRPDENRVFGLYRDGAPLAAYARIHHDDMDGAFREIGSRSHEGKCPATDVAGRDFVSDIDQACFRGDPEDDAFHCADKPVARAEVGGQGDDAHGGIVFAE